MKHILFLSTGGTIASTPTEAGLVPGFTGEDMAGMIPGLHEVCRVTCKAILSLDSTNVQPEEWRIIAREAYDGLEEYDGVVISHGTDTMGYTAAGLSFMLRGLHKPVILTGSQRPIDAPGSDGRSNLLDAFRVASSDCHGVFVVFNGRIIGGTHAVKVRTRSFDAFNSINEEDAGAVVGGDVRFHRPMPGPEGLPMVDDRIDPSVLVVKLTPGFEPSWLAGLADTGVRGIIIEAFGCGGLPDHRRNLLEPVKLLLEKGIAVIVSTQVLSEGSDLGVYAVGVNALNAGVIPGGAMTTEALTAKLMWILGHTRNSEEIRRMMARDYAGEHGTK